MRRQFLIIFLSFILCFTFGNSHYSFGQVKFYAESDQKQIGRAGYVQVQFTVRNANNVSQIVPPSFPNFNIISGPSEQSGMTITNGQTDQYTSIVFVLQPKKTGNLVIGAATAIVDGKQLHSAPISIEVDNRPGNATHQSLMPFGMDEGMAPSPVHEYDDYILKKGENVPEKIKKNLFVRLEVSKNSCYVNEPFVATYKLYSRLKCESSVIKTPSFNGFSVIELGKMDGYNLTTETLNGRTYNVYVLRKVELYPLQSGNIVLEPLEIENKVTFIKKDHSNTGSISGLQQMLMDLTNGDNNDNALDEETVILKSKPVTINVKELPVASADKNFKGAVGSFEISDSLEKQETTIDEGGTLDVTIKGTGNIQMINAPKISWPQGVDGFEPKTSEKLDKVAVPINGERNFSYPFTVSQPGNYKIDPISFTFFDTKTKSYKTIYSNAIDLKVVKGSKKVGAGNFIPGTNANKSVPVSTLIYAGGFLLLGLLVFIFNNNEHKNKKAILAKEDASGDIVSEPTPKVIFKPLENVEPLLSSSDSKVFYETFKNDLKDFLAYKLKVPKEELTRKKINEMLDLKNAGTVTTIKLNSLLDEIDAHLYSAITPSSEMKDAYERGAEVVGLMEKQVQNY